MKYWFNCKQREYTKKLGFILNSSKEICYETFIRKVDKEDLNNIALRLGYALYRKDGMTLSEEGYVSYYSSQTQTGKKVYYMVHSGIEYVFS